MNKAVIFDMDGVLIDSYQAHCRSWCDIAEAEGAAFTEEDFAQSFGRTSRDIIIKHFGSDLKKSEIKRIDDDKESRYRQIVADDIPIMPGAMQLIATLRDKEFDLAVASSGPSENVNLAVAALGGPAVFKAIVTGNDVLRGKPDPQVFIIASTKLKLPPSHCVVVEDAPDGVTAAKAASMKVITLLSTGRCEADFDDNQPDLIIRSLTDLSPQIFTELVSVEI